MKKVLSIVLALAICVGACFVFASCSKDDADAPKTDAVKYKIGIVQLVEHVALDAATEGFNKVLGIMLSNGLVTFAGAFLAIPYRKRQYKAKHMVKSKGGKANA